MARAVTVPLRALVPSSLSSESNIDELPAVFHGDTGVLNVLAPGSAQSDLAVSRVVCSSEDELPPWACQILEKARTLDRRTILDSIIATTHNGGDQPSPITSAHAIWASEPVPDSEELDMRFCLFWDDGEPRIVSPRGEFEVERYDLTRTVFSRNTGILETDIMSRKHAIILGCGSVGSLVAAELARAGVGSFALIDMDVLEYHNVCRHQCGISDVGRRKPDVVRDLILNINPAANIDVFYTEAQQVPLEVFESHCVPGDSIVIGCADNREVDRYGNSIAADHNVPFLGIGFWERAFAGEVFYWIPDRDHACYECAFGHGETLSQRVEANHHIYTSQNDLAAVNFEPGISVDIDFVTIVGVKLVLDILNRGDNRFTQRLLPHFSQYTLICNTNEPSVGGEMAEIFSYPLQVTTSLQVSKRSGCRICGASHV